MSEGLPEGTKEKIVLPTLSVEDAFDMLCIRAGEGGRDEKLFGGCIPRARQLFRPFVIGNRFPTVFLECPLAGVPFLDMTVLYGRLPEGCVVKSKYAEGCDELFRLYGRMKQDHPDICFGFELDTSKEEPGTAAVHLEPRDHIEVVEPFCEAIGEARYAKLYLQTAAKLADTMPPSFFGMFKGRSDAPLRVCGYLGREEMDGIINDRDFLLNFFKAVGFTAYDDAMVDEIVKLMQIVPCETDYQFDIYPDGKAGEVFSIDLRLNEQAAASVRKSFESGDAAKIMSHFSKLGIADDRISMLSEMATSLAFPSIDENGEITGRAMVIYPMWLKIRWKGAHLQNAKCYSLLNSGRI